MIRPARLTTRDRVNYDRLNNLIQLKCSLLGIDPALVGNTGELKELVKLFGKSRKRSLKQLRQTQGWRKSFLEDFLRQNR